MSYGDYRDKKHLREMAAKAGVDKVGWVKRMINSTLFLQDTKKRSKLLKFLTIKMHRNVKEDHPFLPAPPKSLVSPGAYDLVSVVTGKGPEYPARLRKADATEHGIIVGPSGAGKTYWLTWQGQQIHRRSLTADGKRNTAVWFFDTEGQIPAYMAGAKGC